MPSEVNPDAISRYEVLPHALRQQLAVIKAELEALQEKVFPAAEEHHEKRQNAHHGKHEQTG